MREIGAMQSRRACEKHVLLERGSKKERAADSPRKRGRGASWFQLARLDRKRREC